MFEFLGDMLTGSYGRFLEYLSYAVVVIIAYAGCTRLLSGRPEHVLRAGLRWIVRSWRELDTERVWRRPLDSWSEKSAAWSVLLVMCVTSALFFSCSAVYLFIAGVDAAAGSFSAIPITIISLVFMAFGRLFHRTSRTLHGQMGTHPR
jgi:hypothetical protein